MLDVSGVARIRRPRVCVNRVVVKLVKAPSLFVLRIVFGLRRSRLACGGGSENWRFRRRARGGREDVWLPLAKPAANFPFPGLVEAAFTAFLFDNTIQKYGKSFEVDGLEDPAIKAGIDISLTLLLNQRSRDSEDGHSTIDRSTS